MISILVIHTHINHNKGGGSANDFAANVFASSNETFTDHVIKQATVEACMSFEAAMWGAKDSTSTVVTTMPTNEVPSLKSFVGLLNNEANIAHARFGFNLYGYFVRKRVAFPIIEYYVKNVWKNYSSVHVMMNAKGFFFFKFASIEGMNGVLENVPIWVKLHDISIVAFTTDGLSAMATKLGNLIMLDSYTSSMYDREVLYSMRVKYEWKPPRCCMCMIFGHDMLHPKRVVGKPMNDGFRKDKGKGQTSRADDECFIEVKKKKSGGNNGCTKNFAVSVKPKTQYRPKAKQSFKGRETPQKRLLLLVRIRLRHQVTIKNDDGKPLENIDYLSDLGNNDEVKPIDNVMATFLASKSMGGEKGALPRNDKSPYFRANKHETSLEGPILEDVEETITREEVDLGISPPNTELDEGEFEDLDIEHVDVEDFLKDLID
ncbi:zinc knuckle CX2CX4HX4C containing protein [Tanacetum coccineum]